MFVITGLGFGGAEHALLRLLSAIDRALIEPHVVVLSDLIALQPDMVAAGVNVYCPAPGATRRVWGIAAHVIKVVRDIRPDFVLGWMLHGNAFAAVSALLLGQRFGWSVRHSVLPVEGERLGIRLLERSLALISRLPKTIIYNSRSGKAAHESRGYSAASAIVIPNGVALPPAEDIRRNRETWRARLSLAPDNIIIGTVGRYHPMKDISSFLDAGRYVASHRSVRLFLIGEGLSTDNGELTAMLKARDLEKVVNLLGPRRDVMDILPAFDIFSSSSISEGFSNAIAEAMSCGVPCVVTDVGDSAWLVGDTGHVVPPSCPAELGRAWLKLSDTPADQRRHLGERARHRIRQHFSIERFVDSVQSLLLQTMR